MNLSAKLRRCLVLLAMLLLATSACALAGAGVAAASQHSSRVEQRTIRAEERRARRANRRREAEARRAERAAQRAARHSSRSGSAPGVPSPESGPSPATSAHSDRGCTLTLSPSAPHVLAGETVTLSGTLDCPASAATEAQHVAISARGGGASAAATTLAAITPEAGGSFTITSAPLERNTVFQAREGRHRARAVVRVAPAITLAVGPPATVASSPRQGRHSHTVTSFTGSLSPAAPGALVALQVLEGERWRSIAWAHTAADGSYAIHHAFRAPGAVSLRAIAHTGRGHAPAISAPLAYEATQAQSPPSSSPLSGAVTPVVPAN
jgi:hypothetical protein